MAKKDFGDTKLKDLPQPNQWWRLKNGELVKISGIRCNLDCSKPGEWFVDWYYINSDGEIDWRVNLGRGPSQVCDGYMRLSRFLQNARKEKGEYKS